MSKIEIFELQKCVRYSADTGDLFWCARPREHFASEGFWKAWNVKFAGRLVQRKDARGYPILRLTIKGKKYQLRTHRAIFAIQTGEWPPADIDHRNRRRDDNRWTNLRPATRAENVQNTLQVHNASGLPGVFWSKRQGKWWARIKAEGKRRHLGSFTTAEEAHAAYLAAKASVHPFSLEAAGG